jgi:hypothetical protein
MPYNQLSNLDYFDIKNALRDYLRANSSFSDYDFEGSTLGMLLDVLSYNTYYTAFNANMLVNETFLDSATLRDNVVAIAKQLGYTPRSAVASSAAVSVTLQLSGTNLPETVILKRGNSFLTILDDTLYQFGVLDDVQGTVLSDNTVTFTNLKIYEGSFITNRYTVDSSVPFTVTLQNPNIDTSTLRVRVYESSTATNYDNYLVSDNILNVGPNSTVFFINEVEDENYKLYFGDGVFGKKLTPNQIVEVSYVVTNGPKTNNVTSFQYSGILTDINGNSNFQVSVIGSVTTVSKSFGGSNIESIESIKVNAPALYGAQNRAVTATDYAAIIRRAYPAAADIIAYGGEDADPPEYGKVKITIKPKGLNFISSYTKNVILSELRKYSVASVVPEIVDPSIIFIELRSKVFYDQKTTNLGADKIKTKIIENINSYTQSSDTEKFGGKFRYSKFISVIDNSDRSIRSNLTDIVMRKDFYPSLNNKTYYELCFSNPFDDDIDTQTLTSTGFVVQEYPQYISYLEDRDDKIVLFRLDSQTGEKIVLNNNQGVINYKKGELQIFDLTIIQGSFPDNKIEVRLKPQYNDILAKREIYLDVDIDKSVFTLIQE